MFNEGLLENLIVGLIKDKNYEYVHGDNLERTNEEILLVNDLITFLTKRYPDLTTSEIKRILLKLEAVSNADLYQGNKETFNQIVRGYILKREDQTQKDIYVNLIDFDNPENNIFKVCNQVVIQGPVQKRIPDMIIYINGIPMIVWEFKTTVKEDTTIYDAYKQLTIRYRRDIPELFKYNAFVVISDGVNSKMGSLFADYEHFYAWRKVDENDSTAEGIDSLYTMIDGLFTHERLLEVIKNFIYFSDNSGKNIKIVANYPQYFAATKLHNNVLVHKKPEGDGKGGTYFGTTGCGKSYTMLFLANLLTKDISLSNPSIVLITDRTDLDDQLSEDYFTISKEFLNESEIYSVDSRENLGDLLKGRMSGGIFLTTIQKFSEEIGLLSDRDNIICISDEAHRSQINLDQKTKITNEGVKTSYGYATYLHKALPNATFIGFTGTPIEETYEVFGGPVEAYTMSDAVKDGITVKLMYDGRFAKAILDSDKLAKIEKYYQDCLNQGANEYQVEASKKETVNIKTIIGDKDILTKVAENFIEHYENRVNEGSTVAGKCMFICESREIAYDFYKIVAQMRPEWIVPKLCPDGTELTKKEKSKLKEMPMMKMVMTRSKDDPVDLWDLLGDDDDRKEAAKQFKKIKSNFKIAIVVDMWLTGFDVKFLDTIYIDKLLKQEHSIVQTISRVNRAYPGKTEGLIVDFIGIKSGIDRALAKYTKADRDNVEGIEQAIKIVKDQLEIIDNIMYKFDSSKYYDGSEKEKLDCLNRAVEFVQTTKDTENRFMANTRRMSKAFNLCNGSKDFTNEELDKVHYYKAIRSIIFKLTKGTAPDTEQMNAKVRKMIQEAIKSNDVEELFITQKDMKVNKLDLFSEEYLKRISKIELRNTKIKILQQLLSQAIEEFKHVNKIKAVSFSDRLKTIVDVYNMRALDEETVNKILDDTANALIELMNSLKTEKQSFEELGINYEEKAFYDVLVAVEKKYNFEYPEEKNIYLAKEIHKLVVDNSKYAEWHSRPDIKAELQFNIIVLLSRNKFPDIPAGTKEDYKQVYNDVLEQSENFKKYYNV